jgi:uncharacterized protein (TIGR03435 family)
VRALVLTAPDGAAAGLRKASVRRAALDAVPMEVTVSGQMCPGVTSTEITAHAANMGALASALEDSLSRPVIDETGLAGRYDFHVPEAHSQEELFRLMESELGIAITETERQVEVLTVRPDAPSSMELRAAL